MHKTSKNSETNVLVVDKNSGNVLFVTKSEETSAEAIYVKTESIDNGIVYKTETDDEADEFGEYAIDIAELQNSLPNDIDEDDGVVEEYLDECFDADTEDAGAKQTIFDHEYVSKIDEKPPIQLKIDKKPKRCRRVDPAMRKTQRHKLRQLTGRPACKYCDKVFICKESRAIHVCPYLQCDPKNYICRICNKELSRKTFSNHLHETLACQYCSKTFMNPRNLKAHLQHSHANESYVPPKPIDTKLLKTLGEQDEIAELQLDEETGQWFFPDFTYASAHPKKRYQPQRGRFECDKCGRILSTFRSLRSHIDIHTNNFKYVCTVCGEKYATSSGLSKHACLNKKRKRPEVDFRTYDVRHCKYCGLSFETLEANQAHSCENQFDDDPKSFKCRFCDALMSKNSYNKHMARHLTKEDDLICKLCGKRLADLNTLQLHYTTHTGDKPFKCEIDNCTQSFINKSLLHRHMRFHGIEVEKFHCKVCGKEVASKYHLKSHMKIHLKTVECKICKQEFPSRELLKEHYEQSHDPFACMYCDKTFTLLRYLKMHENTHKDEREKPFKCNFCRNKAFSRLALLTNHMLKNHEELMDDWKNSLM